MIGPAPICLLCMHFRDGIGPIDPEDGERSGPLGCAAFPELPGIPDAILESSHDHRQPYDGDHGIQFEPQDEAATTYTERLFSTVGNP